MKFLLDANMPRSSADMLRGFGHEVEDVREVLPPGAGDDSVAAHAKAGRLALITRDFDFADIRNYPPADYFGMVILGMPDDATAVQINRMLESFACNVDFLARLPGRLAIVESWRVRFRPA
jgi:predicted nuclease of predicted toxin-antitoxin system